MTRELLLRLIAAIITVESGGDPAAVGDSGLAVGVMQIHPCYVADVNRIVGREQFALDDRTSPAASVTMFLIYIGHYCTPARIGRAVTAEDIARIHKSGPNGYKKPCSIKYWKKVEKTLTFP